MAEDIRTFLQSFNGVKQTGSHQYICKCPVHDDKKASLSIKDAGDKILLHCQAGCNTEQILSAVGKSFADIQPGKAENKPIASWQRNLVAEYRYTDADGKYLYSKLRYEGDGIDGKEIRYARIIDGAYTKGKGNHSPVLYNLEEVKKSIASRKRIYYVEGEKDVETLRKFGMTGTTAGGVADWKPHFADELIGAAQVIIIADRDQPGRELAERVSNDIESTVISHKIITPSASNHGDVTDYLEEENGSIEDLFSMIEQSKEIGALWTYISKNAVNVNTDLLAMEIMKRNQIFIARNPGTKSDMLYLYKRGKYIHISDAELRSIVRSWLPVGKATTDRISKTSRLIMDSAQTRNYAEINADERIINLENGLLDIYTGALKEHNPLQISTLQLRCSIVSSAKAPNWEKYVNELCYDPEAENPDAEMIARLQEITGIIMSSMFGYRTKKAFILYSARGNTGKSVFGNVISGIVGADASANVPFKELGSSRWATGRLLGKRIALIGDEGGSRIESSQTFKQLTGGDSVGAEMKGLQAFDYKFTGVIIAFCNQLPFFDDDKGDHVAERLMFLNCRNTIPEAKRDPFLTDKLLQERDGIFQWAWEGLQRYISNGMKFSPCRSSDALMEEYRARHDTMYAFLKDRIDITGDKKDYIRKTDFERMYKVYCEEQEVSALGKRNIPQRLASLGIVKVMRDGYEVYLCVRLRAFEEVNSEDYPPF